MSFLGKAKGFFCLVGGLVFLVGSAQAQTPQTPQTKDPEKIASFELERSSSHPKWWPFPLGGGVSTVVKEVHKDNGAIVKQIPSLTADHVYSLGECLDIAIKNHEGLKVARKQVELALAKLDEAKRARFPNATFRSSLTKGETRTAPFKEQEFIFRIEQPLFDGGGIKLTVAQAQTNLEIARSNYDKVVQDLRFEVEKNYYELAKLLLQFDIQKESLKQSEPTLELAKKQLDVDVITRLEYLNVQSLYYQILYQHSSVEKDVTVAGMNLQHTLNVTLEPAIRIDYQLSFKEFGGTLQEYQQLASNRRPEILINSLLVRFHDYGRRVHLAKKRWKVDLASSYGASGGAFKGEELSLGDDFFVGLQVTRPLGIHSVNSSVTTQETSPKLGQSDRTKSTVASSEIGLFNQYPQRAEEKELEVSYRQAVMELDKIQKTVETEVSEAYFNTQKAEILYQAQKGRVEFREKGLVIVQLQQQINEALLSNVLEAHIQLAQERVALVSALADYHLSLANLNRTTGYAL